MNMVTAPSSANQTSVSMPASIRSMLVPSGFEAGPAAASILTKADKWGSIQVVTNKFLSDPNGVPIAFGSFDDTVKYAKEVLAAPRSETYALVAFGDHDSATPTWWLGDAAGAGRWSQDQSRFFHEGEPIVRNSGTADAVITADSFDDLRALPVSAIPPVKWQP